MISSIVNRFSLPFLSDNNATLPFSKTNWLCLILGVLLSTSACKNAFHQTAEVAEKRKYHSAYDDSTLGRNQLPVMMPYNRIISPAGEVVSYGNPTLENHTLDIKPIPGTSLLAIEDRYGVAILEGDSKKIIAQWDYSKEARYKGYMSTYSGLDVVRKGATTQLYWSAANPSNNESAVLQASWNGKDITIQDAFSFKPEAPSPLALPNEVSVQEESGKTYLYVVLNGNNKLVKIEVATKAVVWSVNTGVSPYGLTICGGNIYVTNWGGNMPADNTAQEIAGVPYGSAYVNPQTGSILAGSVSVFGLDGSHQKDTPVGLHPNDIISSNDGRYLYVANGNSDDVSVISTQAQAVVETIPVKIVTGSAGFIGDTPNALALDPQGDTLYVANGMDNAVAVVQLGRLSSPQGGEHSRVAGYIPTEAYPGGLALTGNTLFVTNLEGEGARISSRESGTAEKETAGVTAYNSHRQKATLSLIQLPDSTQLTAYTEQVKKLMLHFRTDLATLTPRPNQPARPLPERIGEPSVFTHVVYIIKENRTYDQVLGDLPQGNGTKELCVFGDSVTPNQHQLARNFVLLDNYYASGKCSAEGHQWTDAAMVTDYIEKNVRAWFRSYPHVQTDAMVYNQKGFIWNNAADHGKKVRIYGEACIPDIDPKLSWTDIYTKYKAGQPPVFTNVSTISRVRPMLSPNYPGSDYLKITDQIRADAFIKELHQYENMPGDSFPNLSVMALSTDHTTGTRPGMPTPRAMIADNDLALGRIIEALSKSRFWKNTVVFVTEDDSQAGWDHVSAYRTTGFVVSPYGTMQKTVSTNYNQTSMVRSIEQILGIPPMNALDATALPMFDCFTNKPAAATYTALPNKIPLDEMNPGLSAMHGKALYYAQQSLRPEYDHVDGGSDDMLNRILWFSSRGSRNYPSSLTGKEADDD